MTNAAETQRRFPQPSWAWPDGALDLALTAILAPDEVRAEQAARQWFSEHEIDDVGFREHRLLTALSARFGKSLSDLPEYPRLLGLQRMLWTKSRMAFREAAPSLQELADAGISVMVFKGAGRIALNADTQKSRVSHDVDIIVRPSEAAKALNILTRSGWTPSSGESSLCLQSRISDIPAINLFYGHFGDLDLHQWGYGRDGALAELEEDLWENAKAGDFFGVPVLVPSPEDRLALTLKSSALDSHAHSDWLVDCAQTFQEDDVDEERLRLTIEASGVAVEALIAFSYLRDRIGLDIPTLSAITEEARRIPMVDRWAKLLQAKPRTDWTTSTKILRGLAKMRRLMKKSRVESRVGAGPIRGRNKSGQHSGQIGLSHLLGTFDVSGGRNRQLELELSFKTNGRRRRYEFEINTQENHVARLRWRDLFGSDGWRRLRFHVELPEHINGKELWIEARPGKNLRTQDPDELAHYKAVAFAVEQAKI